MGGSDDLENIVEVSIEKHADLHRQLWEEFGNWQDYLAWQGLSKRMACEKVAREAARKANTGKFMSFETRRKISEAKKGKKQSTTHVENNRKARIGKQLTIEHSAKISEALSGRTLSEEHKKNVGKKMKGRVMSEKWRNKLSEAAKKRHARNREIRRSRIDSSVSSEN